MSEEQVEAAFKNGWEDLINPDIDGSFGGSGDGDSAEEAGMVLRTRGFAKTWVSRLTEEKYRKMAKNNQGSVNYRCHNFLL